MSFSSKVKFEIAAIYDKNRHCQIAELAAVINYTGIVTGEASELRILVHSESELVVIKFIKLVHLLFGYSCKKVFIDESLKQATVNDSEVSAKILFTTGLIHSGRAIPEKHVNKLVTKNECCKKAYIRGAFFCSGSVSDPDKCYHLELVHDTLRLAADLSETVNSFGPETRIIERKGSFVVYAKEAGQIVDILNIIGSHTALLEYENARVEKDMNNYINRKINFSNANDDKTIAAAVTQTSDIVLLKERDILKTLPAQLQAIAEIRLENPQLSLKELGEMLNPPLSKSGVNHRLRKITAIAEKIKNAINTTVKS